MVFIKSLVKNAVEIWYEADEVVPDLNIFAMTPLQ